MAVLGWSCFECLGRAGGVARGRFLTKWRFLAFALLARGFRAQKLGWGRRGVGGAGREILYVSGAFLGLARG